VAQEKECELCFETRLMPGEIANNFADVNLYDGLMEALHEALEYEKTHKNRKF
jgi:hypothetical protein